MIRPILTYAAPAIQNVQTPQLNQMESTQRRAIRIAHHLNYDFPSADLKALDTTTSIYENLCHLQRRFLERCSNKNHHLHNFIKGHIHAVQNLKNTPLEDIENDIKELFI